MSIKSVMPYNHLTLYCPCLFQSSIFACIRSFPMSQCFASRGQSLEFQLQHQSFQWIFRTISFRMDWLDLLAVQGTLRSLLQHHHSKASILQFSAFFIVQLSHSYMATGGKKQNQNIALTRWTFVGKVMSPLFNMLLKGWS